MPGRESASFESGEVGVAASALARRDQGWLSASAARAVQGGTRQQTEVRGLLRSLACSRAPAGSGGMGGWLGQLFPATPSSRHTRGAASATGARGSTASPGAKVGVTVGC